MTAISVVRLAVKAEYPQPAAAPKLPNRSKEASGSARPVAHYICRPVERGCPQQIKIRDATRITDESVQAATERNKQKKAA